MGNFFFLAWPHKFGRIERIRGGKKIYILLSRGNRVVFPSIHSRLNETHLSVSSHLNASLYVYRSHLTQFPQDYQTACSNGNIFPTSAFIFLYFRITWETTLRHFNLAISVLILSHPRHMAETLLNDLAFSSVFFLRSGNSYIHTLLSVSNREATLYF